jgi:excisionase family DNA binding protein
MEALKLPTRNEQRIAQENKEILNRIVRKLKKSIIEIEVTGEKDPIKIPVSALKHLNTIIELIAQGKAITVNPVDAEITTQEAAEILYVSKSFVVKLLEDGKIPYHKVGAHHRIKLKDLLVYKEQMEKDRKEALTELTRISQELGLDY